jgi:glucosylceramidase
LAVSGRLPAWAGESATSSPVKVWATFRDKRYAQTQPLAWKPATQVAPDAIALNPSATRQEILGFGGALTDATCYVLSQLASAERQALMHDLFAPGEMAMNVCRNCIGASDYSRTLYSFDESSEPDPELKKFSIDHDKAYILPIMREARNVNPELFLFSSPWSPPGWMKPNGSMLGGAMRKLNFEPYSRYFLKFLEGYKAEGVSIDAVTVQNETDAEQDGRMPACLWAQEQEIDFVQNHLGPALRNAGSRTRIWILDHNYSLWGRAIDELSVPEASQFIDGIAWHGYVGEPSAMTRVHNAFPQKNAYWTEGGPDVPSPTTRPTTPSGLRPSTAFFATGRAPSPPGILPWTKKESRTSDRFPAAASSPSRMQPTKSQRAASIGPSRTTPNTCAAVPRSFKPMASAKGRERRARYLTPASAIPMAAWLWC